MFMFDVLCAMCDITSHPGQQFFSAFTSDIAHQTSHIVLAWRPFLDPAPVDRYWLWLLPPLILVIALVYRTIKSNSLARLPKEAGFLALQISVFMVLAAAALWLLLLLV